MSFELLSEPIRRYVRDKRWDELRPIQNAGISRILSTEENYILASRTASGKTEAAFLPILSSVNFCDPGAQVLYVSPLKALINDQFHRIEDLCKYLDVTVTKWHGEANRSSKERLLKHPSGVVLITPESLEAMFANKPFNVKHLFSDLKFVVIDEIHSFIGTDRGTHLKSLLFRLQHVNRNRFRLVGLSATIGDYEEAKNFTGDPENTKVLLDRAVKAVDAEFRYYEDTGADLPLDLVKDLYRETCGNKVLVFPNSRGLTEEIAVKLRRISEKFGGHQNYFSHHSSVDKDVREFIEFFAKTSTKENFTIVCTSTLELGIDIGAVDEVVQINATHSISSLIQRVGRSGRQDGKNGRLFLYATDRWNLLQALACWSLYLESVIEPPFVSGRPYDILLHQVLSITKSQSGISERSLASELQGNFAFSGVKGSEIEQIIEHLVRIDLLERLRGEVIIGIDGEKVVNSRDFYSVFMTDEVFKVVHAGRPVGQLPISPQIVEGENILLAARVWKISHVDFQSKTVEVVRAPDGKKPLFGGGGGVVHKIIRERMLALLHTTEVFEELNNVCRGELNTMRNDFSKFAISDLECERPFIQGETSVQVFTFTGSKINAALKVLLEIVGVENKFDPRSSSFELSIPTGKLQELNLSLLNGISQTDEYLTDRLTTNPSLGAFSKWSEFLPTNLQVKLIEERVYDFVGVSEFLKSCRWVGAKNK